MPRLVSSFRDRLAAGEARGLFLKLASAEVVELASASVDFVVVDLEHSALTEGDAIRLAGYARILGLPAVVRLPTIDRGLVNRLLEAGAVGIQLSSVRSAGQVTALREAMLYPPLGTRSVSLAHPMAGYGAISLASYIEHAESPLLVAQIETADTDEPLEDVLAAGPDVAFVGATDLAVDLGLDDERLARRIEEISTAVKRAGVILGGFGLADPDVRYRVDSSDIAMLRKALADAS
jgi:4-hydroxy-2-oxoheptanedioate aldolase